MTKERKRKLYIIRHAKSSWLYPELSDHDRPLNSRGRKDVQKMGHFLSEHFAIPDSFITSSASRALYTALHIADRWGFDENQLKIFPNLYHASLDRIEEVLHSVDPNIASLALFGHNPGLTDWINEKGIACDNLPTCGIVVIEFTSETWRINELEKTQLFFPKKIK